MIRNRIEELFAQAAREGQLTIYTEAETRQIADQINAEMLQFRREMAAKQAKSISDTGTIILTV